MGLRQRYNQKLFLAVTNKKLASPFPFNENAFKIRNLLITNTIEPHKLHLHLHSICMHYIGQNEHKKPHADLLLLSGKNECFKQT